MYHCFVLPLYVWGIYMLTCMVNVPLNITENSQYICLISHIGSETNFPTTVVLSKCTECYVRKCMMEIVDDILDSDQLGSKNQVHKTCIH